MMLVRFALILFVLGFASAFLPAAERRDRDRKKGENEHTITINNLKYSPAKLTIKRAHTVTWENEDDIDYTVIADDGTFKSGTIKAGGAFSHKFPKPGKYPYTCKLHPRMKGLIIVE